MNLFVVENTIEENVRSYFDTHVVKMPTEHYQMISFNVRKHFGGGSHLLMKGEKLIVEDGSVIIDPSTQVCARFSKAYYNHPCTVWARQCLENSQYIVELTFALEREWRHRYGHAESKRHLSVQRLEQLVNSDVYKEWEATLPSFGYMTTHAKAVPERWKSLDAVQAYRHTYVNEKAHLCKYSKRTPPKWFYINVNKEMENV